MKQYKINLNQGSYLNPHVKVSKSKNINGNYNLGVFALNDINEKIVIERAPFLEIESFGGNLPKPLSDYVFRSHLNDDKFIIAFGYGSMYNHNKNNNVAYFVDEQQRFLKYVTTRNIKKGEELYINYGNDHSVNEQ